MNDLSTVFDELAALPTGVLIALGVLYAVQIGLAVYALINLWKTPVERIQMGKKWVWVLIILFVNMIGAIIYLVAGRKPAAVVDPVLQVTDTAGDGGTTRADRAAAAADLLYGTKEGE
ncbi:MAG: PLD nuclease N-terminal domain-containing protein [Coriobacteriia bacterium]|nr:PLD nuclease N-terminal domain-containing protein [Coriobacteriia bacterium]